MNSNALPRVETVTDLVWVQTGFIGDIVLTTAALELAQRFFPDKKQHVITTPVGARVLQGSPVLASRLVFDKAGKGTAAAFSAVRRELAAALGKNRVAVALQTHRSYRSSFLARYLGLPVVTYRETSAGFLAACRVPRVAPLHETARIGLLLEPLGVPRAEIVKARCRLAPLPLTDEPWAAQLEAHSGPVVAIAPGSVWGTKRWLPEGFAAVAGQLLAETQALIVFLGSEAERPLADEISASLGAKARLLNLAGKTSLDDLRRIFPRLSLLLANDSSPVHYASAFDVPTIELFGATVPGMGFGPGASVSRTLGVELECRPCSDHGPKTCPLGHFRCMRELPAAAVYAACRAVLAERRPISTGAGSAAPA